MTTDELLTVIELSAILLGCVVVFWVLVPDMVRDWKREHRKRD